MLCNLVPEESAVPAEPGWKAYYKILGNYAGEGGNKPGDDIALRPYETIVLEK